MSRSNSKIALQLREADTIKTNKTVLKAGGLGSSGNVFEVLDQSNTKYEDKMATLLKFNSRNKKQIKVSSHKMEWMDEQSRLQNLSNKLELSVGSILDNAVAQTPDDEELQDLLDISNGYFNARKKNQSELAGQLHNIKEMLREAHKRGLRAEKSSRNNNASNNYTEQSVTQSIIADLFIKLRSDHAKVWQYWQTQEAELRRSVQASSQTLARSIRNDEIGLQDAQLREEFANILSLCSTVPIGSGKLRSSQDSSATATVAVNRLDHSSAAGVGQSDETSETQNQNTAVISASTDMSATRDLDSNSCTTLQQQQQQSMEAELEIAMEEWLHKIALLDRAHALRVMERDTERLLCCNEFRHEGSADTASAAGGGDGNNSSSANTGGWSTADHDMFLKIYRKAQVTGMQRKALLEILAAELPEYSLESILRHEEWFRRMKMIQTKFKESELAYTNARIELIKQAKQNLHEQRVQRLESLEKERELEQHERHRREVHVRMAELAAQKAVLDTAQRAELHRQEEELRARLQAQEEAIRQERLEKKQQVERYQQAREAAEKEALLLQEEQVRAAQEAVRQLIEQNRPRVERREQLHSEKLDQRRQKELEQELEEMRRVELLNKIAAQVPYYDAIQDASSRLDHITASAKGHEYVASGDPLYRGHLPLNGFTDGKVIQDSRFRLAEALRRCGVAGSEAARAVVAQFHPRPQLAIHGLI